jgi:hypothetical protein
MLYLRDSISRRVGRRGLLWSFDKRASRDALALHKEETVELLSALFYGLMERIFVPRRTRERWAREESLMFDNTHRFIAHTEARHAAQLDRWHEEDAKKGGTYLAHYSRALGTAQR